MEQKQITTPPMQTVTVQHIPLIDLHVHSTASDGSMTPSELVAYARQKNLSAFALTDHDTVDGIEEAISAAKASHDSDASALTVIPGIEISAEYHGQDIHILGYRIDYTDPDFLKEIHYYRDLRNDRNRKMLKKMEEYGFSFSQEQIEKRFGRDTVITRAHYAILMKEAGIVADNDEAFRRFLNPDCPFYIPRTRIQADEAVRLILKANGKPVLAHPLLYHLTDQQLDELVKLLKQAGLMGLEAIYSKNKKGDEERMCALAQKYALFITGGSDFHGTAKPGLELGTGYGDLRVPPDLLKNLSP